MSKVNFLVLLLGEVLLICLKW